MKKVHESGNVNFQFGKFQQHRHDLVAFDLKGLSDDVGTGFSGTLGFAMLWLLEIKIGYRDHLIDFQYDPNRLRLSSAY